MKNKSIGALFGGYEYGNICITSFDIIFKFLLYEEQINFIMRLTVDALRGI